VENHARGGAAGGNSVAQRIGDELGAQVISHREAHDAA
jgi:hypothetical protein